MKSLFCVCVYVCMLGVCVLFLCVNREYKEEEGRQSKGEC